MTRTRHRHMVRAAGLLVGLLIAATALGASRIPPGGGILGTDLTASVVATGELAVTPTGPFLRGSGMKPGKPVTGGFRIRNQTGRKLAVRLRMLPSSQDLDSVLRVRVRSGRHVLYDGGLGGLRRWTARPLPLGKDSEADIDVRAELARAGDSHRGRIVDLSAELQAKRWRG